MVATTSLLSSAGGAGLAQCLTHVRQAQAALACSPRVRDLPRYAERSTWSTVATALTEHYFRLSVAKDNDFTLDAVQRLYRYALAFYPLHYRLPGTYRPTWTRGAVLSWLRRSIGPVTRQWYAAAASIEEPPAVAQALGNAVERLLIVDADTWLSETLQFLDDHSLAPTRRGDLARLIYLPIAYAHLDAAWRERTAYDAKPHQRRVLRASGRGSVGYLG